jgi:hypothetical protein
LHSRDGEMGKVEEFYFDVAFTVNTKKASQLET